MGSAQQVSPRQQKATEVRAPVALSEDFRDREQNATSRETIT